MSKLDTSHECPYLAGYSKDGSTTYIDKRLPKTMKLKDGREVPVDKYLKVHEEFEKGLEDRQGRDLPRRPREGHGGGTRRGGKGRDPVERVPELHARGG